MTEPRDNPGHFDPGQTPEEVTARTGKDYERTDVRTRPPILFMIVVLIALGVVNVVIGGLGYLFYVHNRSVNRPPSAMATLPQVPPEPRLQSSPRADMERMLAEDRALLDGYGWVDRQGGVVRIPIERAMNLVAERGLPAKRHDIPTTAGAAMTTTTATRRTTGR